jgi:hypothetical protein
VRIWKGVLKPLGMIAIAATIVGSFGHYMKYGRKEPRPESGLREGEDTP